MSINKKPRYFAGLDVDYLTLYPRLLFI